MALIDQTPLLSAVLTFMSCGAVFGWVDCNRKQGWMVAAGLIIVKVILLQYQRLYQQEKNIIMIYFIYH